MKWHLAVEVGDAVPAIELGVGEERLRLPIDTEGAAGAIKHNVWDVIGRHQLPDPPPAAVDLFRMAAAVYAADLRISRASDTHSDQWTRDFVLHLPVTELALWEGAKATLMQLLRFLTGDVWRVEFLQAPYAAPATQRGYRRTYPPLDATSTCLLSGGLDSFIGAADALAHDERLYLVSIGSQGSAAHSTGAQRRTVRALGGQYGAENLRHLEFRVSPPRKLFGRSEDTQRSRSIIFLSLGALTSSALGTNPPLIVPENGFITLNVPLAPSRLGTLSTRTTHPETIRLFRQLLAELGLGVNLRLPYEFKTKGEMLDDAADRDWVISNADDTVSCAHPTADRWIKMKLDKPNCGYCLPCLIRRASLSHVDADEPLEYRKNPLLHDLGRTRMTDLRAVQFAAQRDPTGVGVADVLHSGPLPEDAASIHSYVDVYRRGLRELAAFLNRAA
jgi:7-cyano-7-deazaguanine synthase in queuosine biosynthesis